MSWSNLDWDDVRAADIAYWQVLYAAMIERLSVSGPLSGAPQVSGVPPVVSCAPTVRHMRTLRNAIKAMLPSFYRLDDGEYKAWTLADLYADDARNIECIPNGSDRFPARISEWLARVKNCLDVMHTTRGIFELRCETEYYGEGGFVERSPTMQVAIDSAIAAAEPDTIMLGRPFREWSLIRGTSAQGEDYYLAITTGYYGCWIHNPKPLAAIPRIMVSGAWDPFYPTLFDPVGSDWVEGWNELDPIDSGGSIKIEESPIVYPPDSVPDISKPPDGDFYEMYVGYRLDGYYFFDFRTPDGFQHFTTDDKEE